MAVISNVLKDVFTLLIMKDKLKTARKHNPQVQMELMYAMKQINMRF